jgi:hypothetical protein
VYKGRRGIAPITLNLCTIWRLGDNLTLRPFYPQEKPPLPTEEEVGWDKDWPEARKDTLMLGANYLLQSKAGKTEGRGTGGGGRFEH